MKNIFVKPDSTLRKFFPAVQKLRHWAWKFHDRMGIRLVVDGGQVRFLDAVLNFPEKVGLIYSTPLLWNGPEAYEASTSRTIALLVSRSRLFLDIGSNIGIYAVYAGVKFPQVTTFAFEPVPSIWEKNCAFHRANGLDVKSACNLALGDRVGVRSIVLPVCANGLEEEQTATLCGDSWQEREAHVSRIEIQCSTLDAFAMERALPEGPSCLKIDVENFEAAVLRGGRQFIQARRPWIVCEILAGQKIDPETGGRTNDNAPVVALVGELGYIPFAITTDGYFRMSSGDFSQPRVLKDFLLVPTEKISGDISYLAPSTLGNLLPKP